MKKKRIILLASALLLAITLALTAYLQKGNLAAMANAMLYSGEELESKINENKRTLQSSLEKYAPGISRDFTAEEEEQILEGTLSPEDALALLTEPESMPDPSAMPDGSAADAPGSNPSAAPPTASPQTPAQTDASDRSESSSESVAGSSAESQKQNRIIGNYVAKLYLYKAQYVAKLGQLEKSAKDEYSALPEEKQTAAEKKAILMSKISEAAALEKTCDEQVDQLLQSLSAELTEEGGDLSILDVIRDTYENEKALKKAYYLQKLS